MTENLSITHLRTFLWVASLGSFRKTADRMNTTQPAISSRIAKLEEILGARLFHRDTGKIQITPEGEALRPHAESMIQTAEKLVEYIKGDAAASGTLRIGVTEFSVKTWLPDFMGKLASVFPNIEFNLHVDTSHNLKVALITRTLDVVFIQGPINDERIQSVNIASYEHCWVAVPTLGLKSQNIYAFQEIANQHPIITSSIQTRLYLELVGHIKSNSMDKCRLFPCASYSAAGDLAKLGVGVSILPEALIQEDLSKGRLIQILPDWTPSSLRFTGCYLDSPDKQIAVRIIQFVKSLL